MKQDIEKLLKLEADVLTPEEAAPALETTAQTIRLQAWDDPKRLGFPVAVIGRRVKIPRIPFLRFLGYDIRTEEQHADEN